MIDKFLIFDVWSDYGHFKKFYTTSSPLTFSIPPRTAIIGLISAIIGLNKEEYLSKMTKDKANLAIRILNPIKKVRISQNLINTKDNYWTLIKKVGHEPRTQICFEYLKQPKYRIYFRHSCKEIFDLLKDYLHNHKCYYTPYLGISELIADFKFINEESILEIIENKEIEICSVLPINSILFDKKTIDKMFEIDKKEKKYFKEKIPIEMKPGRIVTEYSDVIYEIEGGIIFTKVKRAYKLSNNDVITIL